MKTNGQLQLYPFLRVALFLTVGIVVGVSFSGVVSTLVWLSVAVGVLIVYALVHRHSVLQSCLLWLLVFLVGALLSSYRCGSMLQPLPQGEIAYRAIVASRPVVKKRTVSCDLIVVGLSRKAFKVRASFLRCDNAERLRAGEGIEVISQLEPPRNYEQSTFDYRSYLLFHGYRGTAFILPHNWQGCAVRLSSLSAVDRMRVIMLAQREKLLQRYAHFSSTEQDFAVLSAMTLGDRTTVSSALADDYSVSGAAHVLALSGLHLGIIFSVLTLVFSRLGSRSVGIALVVIAVWAFVFLVGMSPSVMRSAVMLTVYSFISLLNRDSFTLNSLSLAAVAILVANPLDLYDVSFQMSFLSVFAILLLHRPLYRLLPQRWRRNRVVNWLWQMACVSTAAQAGVAPLVAFYFHRFSSYFLLTNFLVIPAATLILYGAVIMLLLAPLPSLQGLVATALFRLVSWLNSGVSFIASWPGASVEGLQLGVVQVFLCYVVIASAAYLLLSVPRLYWFSRRPIDNMRLP